MIKSEIILDSVNPVGNRLTTYVLEYPRYIHSELLTHRVFSKNSASSRAIPIEKMIEEVKINPAIPSEWGRNQPGMQSSEELDEYFAELCLEEWLLARDSAVRSVLRLKELGLHKQVANRLLEPWFHMKIILTATEFENFFALRAHEAAHPDLRKLAFLMLDQYNESKPKYLGSDSWHIPFGDKIDESRLKELSNIYYQLDKEELKRKIAIARCARVSYYNFDGKDDYEADIKLCDRLFSNTPKHLSPTEHVAKSRNNDIYFGNFKGWEQYRKTFKDENLQDPRIRKNI